MRVFLDLKKNYFGERGCVCISKHYFILFLVAMGHMDWPS
jgi:hypothetical protein